MAKSSIKRDRKKGLVDKIVSWHPYKTYLYLTIAGIFVLFLFFIIAFQFSKDPSFQIHQFPKAFVVSTFVLMFSSITLGDILTYYEHDKVNAIRNNLLITCCLGVVFMISQLWGWRELTMHGINLGGKVSGAYLYVISGLHLLHLLGGIVFIYIEMIKVWQKSKDPVKSLIYFTDPFQRLKLELLRTYWHFMDLLWVAIFFYFLFSF